MFYTDFEHDITEGDIGSTGVGSFSGAKFVIGYIQTSPGADHSATVTVSVQTGQTETPVVFTVPLFPVQSVPIVLPLLNETGELSFSTSVTGSNGHYSIILGVN